MPEVISPFDWKPGDRPSGSTRWKSCDAQERIESPQEASRSIWAALGRGVRNRCPACGRAALFAAFLKPTEQCCFCRADWTRHNAGGFPLYIVVLIIGHIVVSGMTATKMAFHPLLWVPWSIWIAAIPVLAVALIQPAKGGVIAYQWWHRAGKTRRRPSGPNDAVGADHPAPLTGAQSMSGGTALPGARSHSNDKLSQHAALVGGGNAGASPATHRAAQMSDQARTG